MESQSSQVQSQKIIVYLDEIRVVLPGTQALLGFQLVAAFSYGFNTIPLLFKYLHILSLILVSISIVLLITPAAFHRIAEYGHDSHRLHVITTRMIIVSMATLGFGLCVDLFVVASIILQSVIIGAIVSGVMLIFCLTAWYIYPLLKKQPVIQ